MTELDEELPEVVEEILAEYGKNIIFRSYKITKDPATRTDTKTLAGEYRIKSWPSELSTNNRKFTQTGDKIVLIAADGIPRPKRMIDTFELTREGDKFTVVDLETIYSGELPVLYFLLGVSA